MTEIWLPIAGFEDYEVSSEGRVRSLARLIHTRNGRTRWRDGQIRRPMPNPKTGHLGVDLYRDGQRATLMLVHRAVLLAFVGPCPPGSDSWAS